jgi:hypothetical protein
MNKFIFAFFLILFYGSDVKAQGTFTTNNEEIERIVDRWEIKNKAFYTNFNTGVKPYSKMGIATSMDSFSNGLEKSKVDAFELKYMDEENKGTSDKIVATKKGIFNLFYKREAAFLEGYNKDFYIKVNPILELKYGKEKGNENSLYRNSRGLEAQGRIGEKLSFYFQLTENQMRPMQYVSDFSNGNFGQNNYKFNPGFGYWKEFGTNGFDYSNSLGYIDFSASKHVSISLGHDRNFYGYGYRSLLLSDNSAPAFFLKTNVNVWKFHYQVLFNQLTGQYVRGGDALLPKKYAAFHLLTYKANKNLDIALFEGVVFNRNDGFDLNYLNPVIFYRSIEYAQGSADNSLMGAQFKQNIKNTAQVYGQLILDDLQVKEFLKSSGWWANKYGIQLGAKYMDVAKIKNLDAQIEFNMVRPYTYSHYNISYGGDTMANYTNYNQALAHPLGANFTEFMFKIRYSPIPKLNMELKYFVINKGLDSGTQLFGNDIFTNTNTNNIPNSFGVRQNQGFNNNINILALNASYQIWHNVFLEMDMIYRNSKFENPSLNQSTVGIQAGIRANLRRREQLY